MNIDFILQAHGLGGRSKDKVPPPPITEFKAVGGNNLVNLSWQNPTDTDFVGVRIQRKVGSYPTSFTDGTTVFNGAATSFTDTTVVNDTTYYYRAFTYDYDNNFNTNTSQQVTAMPKIVVYGVAIDLTNSNPETSVTYTDGAIGLTPGSSWDSIYPFNEIKPVLLNAAGVETAELDKNNFALKKDGTSANITSGDNVMIKIPKVWYKIETVRNIVYVKMANGPVDSTYKCYGHTDGITERDAFYVGAYLSFNNSNVLKSWSGRVPTMGLPLSTARTNARANGNGYNLLGFYQLTVLQILQLLRSKNLDSQSFYGKGYTASTNTSAATTGGKNSDGMYSGSSSDTEQVKIMGIEDFYGNIFVWVDGIKVGSNRNTLSISKNPANFNNDAANYDSFSTGISINLMGYISKILGNTELGFIPKESSGSNTTYFSDRTAYYASSFCNFGGSWTIGNDAGAYYLLLSNNGTSATNVGSRLMYL